MTGRRVAVWEVLDAYQDLKSIPQTAAHFRWPAVLVQRALAYANAFPAEIQRSREGERQRKASSFPRSGGNKNLARRGLGAGK